MKFAIATALLASAASAGAVPLVGLTSSNELALFDSTDVAAATTVSITGLAAGDRLVGIDLRPKDSLIYGISVSNNIYTVNQSTGAATFVASLGTALINPSLGYGIDFNPVADFGTGASLRLTSSAGNNYAVNASTGAVAFSGTIPGAFSGAAYTNTTIDPSAAPAATSLYYIDSTLNTLATVIGGTFNAPVIDTIGTGLGVDVLKANGFEIVFDGTTNTAFGAFNVDDSSLTTGLYSVDLTTGVATSLGTFNGTLSGLTVSPVPEPQTYALFGAGLLALGAMVRRRLA